MKRSWRMIGMCALMLSAVFLLSCAQFPLYSEIEGYRELIASRSQNAEDAEAGSFKPPEIKGFAPLSELPFAYIKPFTGFYTQVVLDGSRYLLDKNGTLYDVPDDVFEADLQFDRYIFLEGGLYGVRSIFGEILVLPLYRQIELSETFILGINLNGTTDIYQNKMLLKAHVAGTVSILSHDTLLLNGRLCGVDLQPLTMFGYDVLSLVVCGARLISDGTYFGYGFADYVIAPRFIAVGMFNEFGYAYAVDSDGVYCIVDTSGEVRMTEYDGQKPVGYDGETLVIWDGEAFGIAGSDVRFFDLVSMTPHGGYLVEQISDGMYRFFSVNDGRFLTEYYQSIVRMGEYYMVKTASGAYGLLNSDLSSVVGNGEFLAFDGTILLVEYDQVYYAYTKK